MSKKDFPQLVFSVCGIQWTAYLSTTRWFNRKYGKDCMAITVCDDKEMFLRSKDTSYETACHELMHAYIWETGAKSMDLNVEQLEELFAECFSKHGKSMIATAEMITAQIASLHRKKP